MINEAKYQAKISFLRDKWRMSVQSTWLAGRDGLFQDKPGPEEASGQT